MHVCMHACMYVCIRIYIDTQIHTYLHAYIHTYIHISHPSYVSYVWQRREKKGKKIRKKLRLILPAKNDVPSVIFLFV